MVTSLKGNPKKLSIPEQQLLRHAREILEGPDSQGRGGMMSHAEARETIALIERTLGRKAPRDPKTWSRQNPERDEGEIRPYGAGKYDTILDSLIDQHEMGTEDIGSVDELGYFALLGFPETDIRSFIDELNAASVRGFGEPLTEAEKEEIENAIGVIMDENDQGFVHMQWFYEGEEAEMESKWDEIQDEYERYYERGEAEEAGGSRDDDDDEDEGIFEGEEEGEEE